MSKNDSQVAAGPDTGASLGAFEWHHHADGSVVHSSHQPGTYMAVTPKRYILRDHKGDIFHFDSVEDGWDALGDYGYGHHAEPPDNFITGITEAIEDFRNGSDFKDDEDDPSPENAARKEAAP